MQYGQKKQVTIQTTKKYSILIFLVLILLLFFYFDIGKFFSLDFFLLQRETIVSYGYLSVLLILTVYAGVSFLYLPIAFLSIFSGYLFGFFWGGVVAYTGAIINILLSFIWARFLFRDFFLLLRNKSKKLDDLTVKLQKNDTAFIFYARLFFLTPYNSLNIVCGISDISFKNYTIASVAGSILQAFFYSYVGSKIVGMLSKENMMNQGLLLSLVLIAFFSLLHFGKRYITNKMKSGETTLA